MTSSLIAHALLIGGLFWSTGERSVAREPSPYPVMVDLVTESAGTAMEQPARPPVEAVRVVPRPVAALPSIEPVVAAESIDEETATEVAALPAEAPPVAAIAEAGAAAADAWADFYAAVRAAIDRAKRYPSSARQMGQEDRVVVSFLIASDGRAGNLRMVSPSRYPVLNRAAIETVQRVPRFPAPPGNEPAGVRVNVPLVFTLHNEGGHEATE